MGSFLSPLCPRLISPDSMPQHFFSHYNLQTNFRLTAFLTHTLPSQSPPNTKAQYRIHRLVIRASGDDDRNRITAWETEFEILCHNRHPISHQMFHFLKKFLMAINNLPTTPLKSQTRLKIPAESSATLIHVLMFSHLNFA